VVSADRGRMARSLSSRLLRGRRKPFASTARPEARRPTCAVVFHEPGGEALRPAGSRPTIARFNQCRERGPRTKTQQQHRRGAT